jgi:hypothetical protein
MPIKKDFRAPPSSSPFLVQHEVMLRPLRLLAVGKAQPINEEDRAFLEFAR